MDFDYVVSLVKDTKQIVQNTALTADVSMKGEADFVTAVDLAINSFLKEKLKARYPEIGFFSEEEKGELSDPCWILDPIDGTTNLVFGYNMSSISLALYSDGEIIFGVVYNPFNDECFVSEKGKGSYCNGKRIFVKKRQISDSIIEFGAGSTRKAEADCNFAIAKEVFCNCVDIRRICSSALDLCFVASGRIDGYFEKVLKPWDIAAGSLILKEAGGRITDYSGTEVQFASPTSVVASNGVVHEFLLKTINKYV